MNSKINLKYVLDHRSAVMTPLMRERQRATTETERVSSEQKQARPKPSYISVETVGWVVR